MAWPTVPQLILFVTLLGLIAVWDIKRILTASTNRLDTLEAEIRAIRIRVQEQLVPAEGLYNQVCNAVDELRKIRSTGNG